MGKTTIAWTQHTWNPVTGCTKIPGPHGAPSGCDNCYAYTFAERWRGTAGHYYENGFDVTLRPAKLEDPLRRSTPTMYFCNSMSDLWHDEIPDAYISGVFDVMRRAPQHTFQVLTKRPERMRRFLSRYYTLDIPHGTPAPLPNVWLGVTIATEADAWRAAALRDAAPIAIRFLSLEPLLGPVPATVLDGMDWAILGGESGRGARPMRESWVRDLVSAARDRNVAPFVKQLGSVWAKSHGLAGKAEDPAEWPADLRVREHPPNE